MQPELENTPETEASRMKDSDHHELSRRYHSADGKILNVRRVSWKPCAGRRNSLKNERTLIASMQKSNLAPLLCVAVALTLLAGCGGSAASPAAQTPAPLSAADLNLIFVVSEDLAFNSPGDINPQTANLTNRGLQRSLMMASFLQQNVLGGNNVSSIYALTPMTHPQTANNYPDMVSMETIQQFAMLNQITLSYLSYGPAAANSYPVNVSYSSAALPNNVDTPLLDCATTVSGGAYSCQGLDFRDLDGANETLLSDLIKENTTGFYVFSAPWETISTLMANISQLQSYQLIPPASYAGPNYIYAISIVPSGSAGLVTYNTNIDPPSTYPVLPAGGIVNSPCIPVTTNAVMNIQVTGGVGGAVVPAGINTNETVYFVRHAEAHPYQWWEDGNYVGAGQWRALDIPNALRGKIHPNLVYSIDPAQVIPGSSSALGSSYSYVRTNTTVLPYAIANNLPYNLATDFELMAQNGPLATDASNFFFLGGQFTNQSLLVGWEHDHIPTTINALLSMYHGGQGASTWPDTDYDTVWTVKLDANGNVSVDNLTCEGISSNDLPATSPQF